MWNYIQKLASAIHNDIVGGLRGYHTNLSLSEEQLEQDIIDERMQVIKEYSLKGILPYKDLYLSINCIPVDCKCIENCSCSELVDETPVAHFEIPQLLNDYGNQSVSYIGSTDKQYPFLFYTSAMQLKNHKYRKRGKNKPYVWIDTTPNEKGLYDCYVFNAPLLKSVSIIAIFKDPRQLGLFKCCQENRDYNITFIDNEVKKRLVEKKIRYYRNYASPNLPNDQSYQPG